MPVDLRPKIIQCFGLKLTVGCDQCFSFCNQAGRILLILQTFSLFVPTRPSINWMRDTHHFKGSSILLNFIFIFIQCLKRNKFQNYFFQGVMVKYMDVVPTNKYIPQLWFYQNCTNFTFSSVSLLIQLIQLLFVHKIISFRISINVLRHFFKCLRVLYRENWVFTFFSVFPSNILRHHSGE